MSANTQVTTKGEQHNMFKRLRLDTENDNFLKLSKEKQKNRARDVLQRQMEEDKKFKALEAGYEASLRKKICTQSLKIINWFHKKHPMIPQEEEPLLNAILITKMSSSNSFLTVSRLWGGIKRRRTRSSLVPGMSN